MSNIQAVPGAGVGYVRAVFSGRARGFAVPVELLRVNARVVNRCAVRRRVAVAFSGYLVSEAGPVELPVWRDFYTGRVVCILSGKYVHGLRDGFEGCGDFLDAPDHLPAGSVRRYEAAGQVCASDRRFLRAGWFE